MQEMQDLKRGTTFLCMYSFKRQQDKKINHDPDKKIKHDIRIKKLNRIADLDVVV